MVGLLPNTQKISISQDKLCLSRAKCACTLDLTSVEWVVRRIAFPPSTKCTTCTAPSWSAQSASDCSCYNWGNATNSCWCTGDVSIIPAHLFKKCAMTMTHSCLLHWALTTYRCTSKPCGLARQEWASGKGSTFHDVCESPARQISSFDSNRIQILPLISSALHHGTIWWPSNCRCIPRLGWSIQVLHDHYGWYITFTTQKLLREWNMSSIWTLVFWPTIP